MPFWVYRFISSLAFCGVDDVPPKSGHAVTKVARGGAKTGAAVRSPNGLPAPATAAASGAVLASGKRKLPVAAAEPAPAGGEAGPSKPGSSAKGKSNWPICINNLSGGVVGARCFSTTCREEKLWDVRLFSRFLELLACHAFPLAQLYFSSLCRR